MPNNAHPDSTFSSHVHNDWTYLATDEYPQPDIRGPMPNNAHPDSTFSSHVHNDWTYLNTDEYPQPDIRGPMPNNAHPDSTFSSHVHNDWTYTQLNAEGIDLAIPEYAGDEDRGYVRSVPSRFQNERDDRLMHSLISRYALEVRQNGKGTGAFFLDKDAAKAVSQEVATSHLNLSGKKAK